MFYLAIFLLLYSVGLCLNAPYCAYQEDLPLQATMAQPTHDSSSSGRYVPFAYTIIPTLIPEQRV
jgi:hypothetical protein